MVIERTEDKLKGLIFDVDGTLAETEQAGHRIAFNRAFEELGLDWNWDEAVYDDLLQVFGGKERVRHFIDEHLAGFIVEGDLNDFIGDLHRRKTRHYVDLMKSGGIPLRSGVERLLNHARSEGLRLGIASTTTPENVTALLTATLGAHSIDWFDVIAAGDIVSQKKPAPDIYEYALQCLDLRASECIAFEDTGSGLRSAVSAGLETVVTVNDATRQQDFSGAAIVLDQLGEPGSAFRVLAGDAHGATCVDVPFLRKLQATRSLSAN